MFLRGKSDGGFRSTPSNIPKMLVPAEVKDPIPDGPKMLQLGQTHTLVQRQHENVHFLT